MVVIVIAAAQYIVVVEPIARQLSSRFVVWPFGRLFVLRPQRQYRVARRGRVAPHTHSFQA